MLRVVSVLCFVLCVCVRRIMCISVISVRLGSVVLRCVCVLCVFVFVVFALLLVLVL